MNKDVLKEKSDILIYQAEDGKTRIDVRLEDETVWLPQASMAELFQTTPQNITMHIKAIYDEGELIEPATCKEYLQVRDEGPRRVKRKLKHYNLDVILAVGYRVRSHRGTQFRRWATGRLREFLVRTHSCNLMEGKCRIIPAEFPPRLPKPWLWRNMINLIPGV